MIVLLLIFHDYLPAVLADMGGGHMGTALNKSIKDFMVRSAAMRGCYTPYVPGWDNHGMPIAAGPPAWETPSSAG